jgi:outer membrane lipoprotein SlyB
MKKITALVILAVLALSLSGCASSNEYGQTYGFANKESKMNPNAKYEVSFGSCVMAIIFCETIIVPVYVVGWNLFEATGKK